MCFAARVITPKCVLFNKLQINNNFGLDVLTIITFVTRYGFNQVKLISKLSSCSHGHTSMGISCEVLIGKIRYQNKFANIVWGQPVWGHQVDTTGGPF